MSNLFLYLFDMLISEVFPSKQSSDDGGILQSKMVDHFCVTQSQKVNRLAGTKVRENNYLLCLLCIVSTSCSVLSNICSVDDFAFK